VAIWSTELAHREHTVISACEKHKDVKEEIEEEIEIEIEKDLDVWIRARSE
jgi:hypothetical protein